MPVLSVADSDHDNRVHLVRHEFDTTNIPPLDLASIELNEEEDAWNTDPFTGDTLPDTSPAKQGDPFVQPRIVGGRTADASRYPYYTRVYMQNQFQRTIAVCGGTLIHEDYVLSAAHCIISDTLPTIAYIVTVTNYTQSISLYGQTGYEEQRLVEASYTHPDYFVAQSGAPHNDYLLLKLSEPIYDIRPVRLNDSTNQPGDNDVLATIGFGLLRHEGSPPNRLQDINLDVVSYWECNGRSQFFGIINNANMICAGEDGKVSCVHASVLVHVLGRNLLVLWWC